jgi:hypothetical protein
MHDDVISKNEGRGQAVVYNHYSNRVAVRRLRREDRLTSVSRWYFLYVTFT